MARPAVASFSTLYRTTGGVGVADVPTGTSVGDLLVASVYVRATAGMTLPSGWVVHIDHASASSGRTYLMSRIVDGTETSDTYTWNRVGSEDWSLVLVRVTGAHPVTPVYSVVGSLLAAGTTSPIPGGGHEVEPLVLYCGTSDKAGVTISIPDTTLVAQDPATSDNTSRAIIHYDTDPLGSLDKAARTVTYGNSSTFHWAAITIIWADGLVPRSAGKTKIETFTASGTWTKDPLARQYRVTCVGGGAGGGSGRKQGGTNSGGGGGSGGCLSSHVFDAADLTSTVAVTVGAGGAGGAAQTVNGTGIGGVSGGTSSFGPYLRAVGGTFGQGGAANSGTAGAASTSGATDLNVIAGLGDDVVAGGTPANVVGSRAAGSGGGGGGATTGPTATAGGSGGGNTLLGIVGGSAGQVTAVDPSPGGNGGNGVDGPVTGSGGGGGAAGYAAGINSANGGNGGNGGFPGGGGGGGGSVGGTNGTQSGAGGAGAHGRVTVEVIY